jgi:hypothetical protein
MQKWGEKVQTEWDKTGFDPKYISATQESLNIITRSVEEYKSKYGVYPNNIYETKDLLVIDLDYSYRIKETDGQTNGVPFYYEKIDSNKFYLAGDGKDGIIKTADDILPQISVKQEKTTGLLKYVIKSFSKKN